MVNSNLVDVLIGNDQTLLLFLNNLGNNYWDGFWLFITNKYTTLPLYLFLVLIFSRRFGFKKTVLLFVLVIVLIAVSDQLSNLFKYGFMRLRPCHEPDVKGLIRVVKKGCGGRFSYFSAHASTGMALAVFFSLVLKSIYKNIKHYLMTLALFVGYSRIYIGVHYPLDVLTGFIIGAVLANVFYVFYLFLEGKLELLDA